MNELQDEIKAERKRIEDMKGGNIDDEDISD